MCGFTATRETNAFCLRTGFSLVRLGFSLDVNLIKWSIMRDEIFFSLFSDSNINDCRTKNEISAREVS